MNRRELLAGGAALAGLGATGPAGAQAPSLRAAAADAFLYGLPMIEMATTRARALSAPGAAVNRFQHSRRLSGPEARAVTTPNNDTLYSSAWIELAQGPVTLTIPPTGDRYISVAGMNMFSDNDFVLGTRTVGGEGGRFTIVGPGQAGSGPGIVRLATPQGWLLARTLIDGPADLPAAHRVQDGLGLEGAASGAYPVAPGRRAPAAELFPGLAALLKANPPPASDQALFRRIAATGLRPDGVFAPPAGSMAELDAGIAEARANLVGGFGGAAADGWSYPPASLGDFGQNYALRAQVALGGLAALPPVEAMYFNPVGDRGRMFTGEGLYRLHFPAGRLPPVDGFWSLTMYEPTPEGQLFLVANPLQRYAIGDRTPGLRRNPDGSLDIWLARKDPGGVRTANWLPAPAAGPFTVTLRTYLPRPELLEGRYRIPPIRAV